MHQRKRSFATFAAVLALALMPALAEAQTKVKSGYNMFSPEQDVEIGRKSAQEVEQQLPLVRDRDVTGFVEELGQRLAAEAPGPKFQYQFGVVDASDINAFALPGGYIYLNRGILENAKNEGEVAGVLAHEIAHVALRHGTHNASKAYLAQAGIGILGGLLGGRVGNNTAQAINLLGGFGLNALFLKYSRSAETDADIIGSQMLARAGYNPYDMVTFFQTLAKTDKRKTVNWLSSHPAPDRRIQRIEKEASLLGLQPKSTTRVARLNQIQTTLRRMPPAKPTEELAKMRNPTSRPPSGGSESMGRVRVDPPSRELDTFNSREGLFQIRYPANWTVFEEGRSGVTIGPRGGIGNVGDRTEVVYGLIVNHYEPFGNEGRRARSNQGVTVEAASEDLIRQIMNASPHLQVMRGSGRRLRVAGGAGAGAALGGTSPTTGIRERVTVVTRLLADDHLMYVLFITPESEARAYEPVLNTMLNSLRIDDHRH